MKSCFRFFAVISFGAFVFFALRVLGLFAPDEYNEFTGIVAMMPAAGCIITLFFALLFFGLSQLNIGQSKDPAGAEISEEENTDEPKKDSVPD
ncbi:MAG: hypothetical protein AAGF67_12455 [Verrucomicrobiota bacterium]